MRVNVCHMPVRVDWAAWLVVVDLTLVVADHPKVVIIEKVNHRAVHEEREEGRVERERVCVWEGI